VEFAFDHQIGGGEAGIDIAHGEAEVVGDIADSVRGLAEFLGFEVFVQERGAIAHGVRGGEDAGERLVVDLDQGSGLLGDVGADSGDSGHGMSAIERFAGSEKVPADIAERGLTLAKVDHTVGPLGKIGRGDYGFHTGQSAGLRSIDAENAGMRVGAAQNVAVEQAGSLEVGAVKGSPGDFVGAIMAYGPGSDHGVLAIAHRCASNSSAC